jgi:hypothetical protein
MWSLLHEWTYEVSVLTPIKKIHDQSRIKNLDPVFRRLRVVKTSDSAVTLTVNASRSCG